MSVLRQQKGADQSSSLSAPSSRFLVSDDRVKDAQRFLNSLAVSSLELVTQVLAEIAKVREASAVLSEQTCKQFRGETIQYFRILLEISPSKSFDSEMKSAVERLQAKTERRVDGVIDSDLVHILFHEKGGNAVSVEKLPQSQKSPNMEGSRWNKPQGIAAELIASRIGMELSELKGNGTSESAVSMEVRAAIQKLILVVSAHLPKDQQAMLLAIAEVESGFNPDAQPMRKRGGRSVPISSAKGIFQFIDDTGARYGLTRRTAFDPWANIVAGVRHFEDNLELARRRYPTASGKELLARVYELHHDGPSRNYGGYRIGKERVAPLLPRYLSEVHDFWRANPSSLYGKQTPIVRRDE
jgi:hypothetical protein